MPLMPRNTETSGLRKCRLNRELHADNSDSAGSQDRAPGASVGSRVCESVALSPVTF